MSTTKSSKFQPFEWLTSPESIGGFVRDHVLESSSSSSSEPPRAMHIGCGSSTVGEYLVRELGFAKVVNVDRDHETMERMAERWSEMTNNGNDCPNTTTTTATIGKTEGEKTEEPMILFPTTMPLPNEESPSSLLSRNYQHQQNPMEFWCLDYTSETLPENYADSFDLVVDKSTLDCTLCSDCSATASFLMEIYRTLKVNGGVYLVISFHELDLILPLLEDLPGAQWTVSHTTMERQVECLVANASGRSTTTAGPKKNNNSTSEQKKQATGNESSRKPLNVLIARRRWPVCETDGGSTAGGESLPPPALVFEKIVEHVQTVNDRWFQDEQPLLTETRIEDLRKAFFSPEEPNNNNNNNEQEKEGGKSNFNSKRLSLEEAYEIVFTDAEREHLTYEHFLEDWEAFCKEGEKLEEPDTVRETNGKAIMTYDLALNFLRANQ
jgi:hypothetical protein